MIVIPNRGRILAVMLALALAGGLLTLTLLAKPAQAQPPTDNENSGATSQWVQFSGGIDGSECTGEVINIEGTMHIVSESTATEGDGHHIIFHFNLQHVTGVGLDPVTFEPTGTEYAVPAASTTVDNLVHTGDQVTGDVVFQLLIGRGQLPDQTFFATTHYIITSEGEVKVEVGQFHLECH